MTAIFTKIPRQSRSPEATFKSNICTVISLQTSSGEIPIAVVSDPGVNIELVLQQISSREKISMEAMKVRKVAVIA